MIVFVDDLSGLKYDAYRPRENPEMCIMTVSSYIREQANYSVLYMTESQYLLSGYKIPFYMIPIVDIAVKF